MLNQRELFLKFVAQTSDAPLMLEIDKAEGLYLYNKKGEKYLDLISGISVSNIGHRHPIVIKAIKQQLDKYLHLMVYGEYVQQPQVKLAKKICELLPKKLSNVYFVNSGSEAVEGALKLAKRYTKRKKIISCSNAYHGSTHGCLSIMSDNNYKNAFGPLLPDVSHISFGNFDDLKNIKNDVACVIIEPIQAEAGIIIPPKGYMEELYNICKKNGVLLIFDEIQTGFGRTGKMFGFENYEIVPDIITLAKGMGGGMPIGAFISSYEIMQSLTNNPVLGHITTFGGHPVSCAASLATINVILKNKYIEKVEEKRQLFLANLNHSKIKEIRSCGLMIALEFESFEFNKKLIDKCISKGVITDWFLFNDKSLRIAPPLTISEKDILFACEVINESIDEI